MRIPVYLTCLLAVVLAALPVRHARADDVSFDVFYNNLADDGDWYNTPEYGYVWHPTVADKSEKWRPYTDGYWAQTDDGWTWVSYENFGWATYHYGRWTRLKNIGWSWVPGYDWGPGWVAWRTSEDHVGWAPLPPRADKDAVEDDQPEGHPEGHRTERRRAVEVDYNTVEPADYGPDVDNQYDIGPDNYCFVETRHFGAPVLAEVIEPPQRNIVIIERTINVTNIYRPEGGPRGPGGGFVVYNRGPDYNFVNAHCERPIQVLRIERHEDVVFLNNGIRGGGNANQVRGGVFTVAAPPIRRGPVNFTQLKPVRVKQTVERTEIVHGWTNSGADPGTVQRLRQQFKQQAQQATPPPREADPPRPEALVRARAEAANQPPAPPANPANNPVPPPAPNPANKPGQPPLTDEQRAARREARQKAKAAAATPAPGQPLVPPAAPDRGPKPGNGQPPAPPAPGANGQGGLTPEERQAKRAQRQQEKAKQPGQQPPAAPAAQPTPPATTPPAPNPERDARRAQRQQEKAQQQQQKAAPDKADQPPVQPSAPPQPDAAREARRAQRQQEKAQQQPPAPQGQPGNAPAQGNPGNPDRDARRAQRQQAQQQQQQQQTPPPQRPQQNQPPQAQPRPQQQQQQGTPQGKGDDDKKKKKDQGNQ